MEGDRETPVAQIRPLPAGGLLLGAGDVAVPRGQELPAAQPDQLDAVPVRGEQQGAGELAGAGALLRAQFLIMCVQY